MFLKIDSCMAGVINWDDFMGYLLTVEGSKRGALDEMPVPEPDPSPASTAAPVGPVLGGVQHEFVRQEDPESAMQDAHQAPIDSLVLIPVHGNFSNHGHTGGSHHKSRNDKAGFAYVSGGRDGVINFYDTGKWLASTPVASDPHTLALTRASDCTLTHPTSSQRPLS